MPSPALVRSFEYSASVLWSYVAMSTAGVLIAMLLARSFSGKSMIRRQVIFSIANFLSLCSAAYFAFSWLE